MTRRTCSMSRTTTTDVLAIQCCGGLAASLPLRRRRGMVQGRRGTDCASKRTWVRAGPGRPRRGQRARRPRTLSMGRETHGRGPHSGRGPGRPRAAVHGRRAAEPRRARGGRVTGSRVSTTRASASRHGRFAGRGSNGATGDSLGTSAGTGTAAHGGGRGGNRATCRPARCPARPPARTRGAGSPGRAATARGHSCGAPATAMTSTVAFPATAHPSGRAALARERRRSCCRRPRVVGWRGAPPSPQRWRRLHARRRLLRWTAAEQSCRRRTAPPSLMQLSAATGPGALVDKALVPIASAGLLLPETLAPPARKSTA